MHRRHDLPPALQAIARHQAGVVTADQLGHHLPRGVARRMAESWNHLGYGLYCLEEPTWLAMAWAGQLYAGGDGVLSGKAAAYLHGALRQPPPGIAVWVPGRQLHTLAFGCWTVSFIRGQRHRFGTMTPARTRIDEALIDAARDASESEVIAMVTRALAQHLTTPARLADAVAAHQRVAHRRLLTDLTSPNHCDLESVLEWLYLTRVERPHGLPTPQRQAWVAPSTRVDNWYEAYRVIIETDGRDHDDFSRDLERDNRLAERIAAVVLRYGWHDVASRPCTVAAQVARVLGRRGWTGSPRRCARCP